MDAFVDVTTWRLETDRLMLRPWREEDLEDFYRYASVPGVGEMAGWAAHENREQSAAILKLFIDEKRPWLWRRRSPAGSSARWVWNLRATVRTCRRTGKAGRSAMCLPRTAGDRA